MCNPELKLDPLRSAWGPKAKSDSVPVCALGVWWENTGNRLRDPPGNHRHRRVPVSAARCPPGWEVHWGSRRPHDSQRRERLLRGGAARVRSSKMSEILPAGEEHGPQLLD